jgi:hypothetical protein
VLVSECSSSVILHCICFTADVFQISKRSAERCAELKSIHLGVFTCLRSLLQFIIVLIVVITIIICDVELFFYCLLQDRDKWWALLKAVVTFRIN